MKWLLRNRRLVDVRLGPICFEIISGWDNAGALGVDLLDFSMAQNKLVTIFRVYVWLIDIGLHIMWY